ncbi:MAG: DUF2339 domain-containing protein [Cocleimonas sp.]|nr:DUF2339 domain-containing protein [Cocleimonas sp.]
MTVFIYTLTCFFLSLIITSILHHSFDGIIVVVLSTVLGFVMGRISQLQNDLNQLRSTLSKDWEQRKHQPIDKIHQVADDQVEEKPSTIPTPVSEVPLAKVETRQPSIDPDKKNSIDKSIALLTRYFTGGNLFVRVGIVILFFGVSFLLQYASSQGMFPIEYRLMGVAIAAIALLLFGWKLRYKKTAYSLLLQGAGIGVLYLDIFSAFSLYDLIPPLPAFVLMFVVGMLAASLAVLQDARALAFLGFTGGFLAPILASSGGNHYIGLFSYYLLLNIGIVTIAWFKAWRTLNLLGFFFTFIVATIWGVKSYQPDNFASIEPFLTLFFLFYVLIAVLFALRQPPQLRGYVDGSLLFGVPLATFGLQYALVSDTDYGVSLSAFIMGSFYLILARELWRRAGTGLKLLSEAFLALGVIFVSLAIPFALAPTHTAAAWGIEGLGLIWLGARQNRLSVRFFGLLLQLGAGFFIFVGHHISHDIAFINATFMSAMMMAVAGILSARLLSLVFEGRRVQEKTISSIGLVWGLLWLFAGVLHQVITYFGWHWFAGALLLLATIVSVVFLTVAIKLKPQWRQAWHVASGLFVVMFVVLLIQLDFGFFDLKTDYPFQYGGWLAWPLGFVALYLLISRLDLYEVYTRFSEVMHTFSLLLLIALITWEGASQLLQFIPEQTGWAKLWFAIPATLGLWGVLTAKIWPIKQHYYLYQQKAGSVLAIYLIFWGFSAVVAKGSTDPLPWVPLLNPLDITLGIVLLTLFRWWDIIRQHEILSINIRQYKPNKNVFAMSIAGLAFFWINFTLFRIATHWFDVPYTPSGLYQSSLLQSAVSVLWAFSGVLLTVFASWRKMRTVWIAGGLLLGIVVLKLFVVDLSALGSLARIISFLVVGVLLTSIGYFAPLPEQESGVKNEV